MSIASVTHKYAFGVQGDIKDNLCFLDDGVYLFVAGANVIIYNSEQKTQRFVPSSEKAECITCITVSPDRRFLAVGERIHGSSSGSKPVVHIYEVQTLRRRRTISCPSDVSAREFVAMAMSADGKYLVTCTGGPDNAVVYWGWEKGKNLGSVKVSEEGNRKGAVWMSWDKDVLGIDRGDGGRGMVGGGVVKGEGSDNVVVVPESMSNQKTSPFVGQRNGGLNSPGIRRGNSTLGRMRSKQFDSHKQHPQITQVVINPHDSSQVCVTGPGVFACVKYSDGGLSIARTCDSSGAQNMLSCAYASAETLILGTATGHMIIIDSTFPKASVPTATIRVPRLGTVDAIVCLTKGLIVAGQGPVAVIYERSLPGSVPSFESYRNGAASTSVQSLDESSTADNSSIQDVESGEEENDTENEDNDGSSRRKRRQGTSASSGPVVPPPNPRQFLPYRKTQDIVIIKPGNTIVAPSGNESRPDNKDDELGVRVISATCSSAEDVIAIYLKDGRMFYYNIEKEKPGPGREVERGKRFKVGETTPYFSALAPPSHHDGITGLDTCIRKPLMVTCSADRSVRVWNYLESTTELVKHFPEEASSVSIHPSGLYILIGFPDKLRLMNLLMDDIRVAREFPIRGCKECRFSSGGHVFAAVYGNTIQIYSTWTFDNIGNLKGHNGKVRSLHWSDDDSKIVSAGSDGAVYVWNMRTFKRESENILKSCAYSCAVIESSTGVVYAVGNDRQLKEISESQITRELDTNVIASQVVLSHSGKMMFVGTSTGIIRSMKFPLTHDPTEYQEHKAHVGAVTRMRVSYDDQYLFTASEDGCLIVYRIAEKDHRSLKKERTLAFAEEILITKSDLEEKTVLMSELRSRIEELQMENEYQLRLKDMNFNEKMKDVTEKFVQDIEALKIVSAVLRTEKDKMDIQHEEELAELKENHSLHLQETETKSNLVLMSEYEKFQSNQEMLAENQERWQHQMRELELKREMALENVTSEYEARVKAKTQEISKLQEEMRQQLKEFQETQKQAVEDIDTELSNLVDQYEKRLKAEHEQGLRLKGENGIMRKKFNTLHKDIEDNTGEVLRMKDQEKKLTAVTANLEKEILALKKEISERDEAIQEKEKRVYDLKKKNQELEKFKFVLDYKIKTLKKQIEPRETDIAEMTSNIRNMNVDLGACNRTHTELVETIAQLNSDLTVTKALISKEHEKARSADRYMHKFETELTEAIAYIQEPAVLQKCAERLYKSYCKEGVIQKSGMIEPEVKAEYARQHEYLRRTVVALRSQVGKNMTTYHTDNVHAMLENEGLIKEITRLRKLSKTKRLRSQFHRPNGTATSVSPQTDSSDSGTLPSIAEGKSQSSPRADPTSINNEAPTALHNAKQYALPVLSI